ncbi:MAG: hypothetical protein Tsb002_13480 [Wenzhouxiangellaceae bacterium]
MREWVIFPHADKYTYSDKQLADLWNDLHAGDRVPWPDAEWVAAQQAELPEEQRAGDSDEALATACRNAWRAYHSGDFGSAVEQAEAIGILAHAIANKATGIYADYLEDDEAEQQALYQSIIDRAETARKLLPNDPNSHYFHAYGLGRYSQSISITKALRQGLGGKVQKSLQTALSLNADHAEAHLAMALFHATVIDNVGKLVGGMTYGASIDESLQHFERALELAPQLPIIHIEHGNGIYLLYGDKQLDEMTAAYQKAVDLTPMDAMQHLDRDFAMSELEE